TPKGASTTTSPAGKVIPGKPEWKKDLIGICVAHGIPYAATATIAYWNDYITKLRKAIEVDGPAVVHVLTPCPLGWRHDPSQTIRLSRLAVQTCYFPLYEVVDGNYSLSMKVSKPLPVVEFLKGQGRFSHLLRPEFEKEVAVIQEGVNQNWQRILRLCGVSE
ncbi:MAG: thiamine pyrophosphate-dependent enzyme, partial [Candidatus Bathyarchaeia archaeon]